MINNYFGVDKYGDWRVTQMRLMTTGPLLFLLVDCLVNKIVIPRKHMIFTLGLIVIYFANTYVSEML